MDENMKKKFKKYKIIKTLQKQNTNENVKNKEMKTMEKWKRKMQKTNKKTTRKPRKTINKKTK